jgi:hypothetical protein
MTIGDRILAAVRALASEWIGRDGVEGVYDAEVNGCPVLVVETATGARPRALPLVFGREFGVVVQPVQAEGEPAGGAWNEPRDLEPNARV